MMGKLVVPEGEVFPARYVGDCVGALSLLRDPSGRGASGKVPGPGLARAVVSKCGRAKAGAKVARTLAHRDIASIIDPAAREEAEMNAEVDRLAGEAAVPADFAPSACCGASVLLAA